MGGSQSVPTLLGGNLNARGLGNSITAEEITQGLNLEQYNAIVTGGSSGLGAEMARVLAKRGAHVTIAAKREDVLQDVKAGILSEVPMARVEVMPLNLSTLGSVRSFAEKYKQKSRPLNILINNGGIICKEFTTSDEGIELMWATHVLGMSPERTLLTIVPLRFTLLEDLALSPIAQYNLPDRLRERAAHVKHIDETEMKESVIIESAAKSQTREALNTSDTCVSEPKLKAHLCSNLRCTIFSLESSKHQLKPLLWTSGPFTIER